MSGLRINAFMEIPMVRFDGAKITFGVRCCQVLCYEGCVSELLGVN